MFLRDSGPEFFQAFEVEIDRTSPDGAATRQRDARSFHTRNQRSQYQRGGPHGFHQVVRSFSIDEIAARNGGAVLGASIAEFDFRSHGSKQVALGDDVTNLGNVFENDRFIGEQSGSHGGEGGILGATDPNRAHQRITAADYEFVHR